MTVYNIVDQGAVGDGRSNDAPAIQAAIDACAAAGGGTVLLPAGRTYLSGSIQLRGNTEFRIEPGATLLASADYADYRREHFSDAVSGGLVKETLLSSRAFITAFEAHGLRITGGGTIDGQGRGFVARDLGGIYEMRGPPGEDAYRARPYTLHLIGCEALTIRDVSIKDGAYWTLRVTGCQDTLISGLRLHNDTRLPNSDGIDIDRCQRVRVSDCDVIAGDDTICLKSCQGSAHYGVCEDVLVTNCTVQSTSSALKIGNECWDTIRNVVFSNCLVRGSHRGLSVHCGEPGDVENVLFANIVVETRLYEDAWWGRGEPIYVNSTPWKRADGVGQIRRLRFTNILARGENGVVVYADTPGDVQDLLFENVRLSVGAWSGERGGRQDLRPREGVGLPSTPTHGFLLRGAARATLRHCEVVWEEPHADYFGQALWSAECAELRVEDFRGEDVGAVGTDTVLH